MNNVSLHLYRNRKTGDVLIQRYANIHAVGKFITVSPPEMQERGLEIALRYLNEDLPAETADKPELETFSKEEERDFLRRHRHVDISFGVGETIRIGPLRRRGSGFVVPQDEVIELSLPSKNEVFLDALNRALG